MDSIWDFLKNKLGFAVSPSTVTGHAMNRTQPWSPAGEGGSQIGQPSSGIKLPVLQEAWYITMNWRFRPDQSTRMILTNPTTNRTVVAAAGYQKGPRG